MLTNRWTEVLAAEEYGLERPTKSYPKRKLLPQFDDDALEPVLPAYNAADRPPRGRDKTTIQHKHQPVLPCQTNKTQQLRVTHMTCGTIWKIEQDKPDRSMDRGGAPQRATTAIKPDITNTNMSGPNTVDWLHQSCVPM